MAINVFEGARRIAKLFAVFIVLGFGVAIVTDSAEPVVVRYVIAGPGKPPILDAPCLEDSATKDVKPNGSERVAAYLCFLPADIEVRRTKFDSYANDYGGKATTVPVGSVIPPRSGKPWEQYYGEVVRYRLIPYSTPPSMETVGFGAKDFPDVSTYIDYVSKNFRVPPSDESQLRGLWWSQTLKNAGAYLLGMLGSLAGLWGFVWTVGWIVRGFMGIPSGSDRRP